MNETKSACVRAAKALSLLKSRQSPPIPSGWFDAASLSEHMKLSPPSTRKWLEKMVAAKLLEEKNWPCSDSRGRVIEKLIYRNI